MAAVSNASPPAERWVMTTGDGHALLSFTNQADGAPEIMFICGDSHRGRAQVLIFRAPDAENAQQIRIELSAGHTSAIAAAEPTALRSNAAPVLIGLIDAQSMRELIQSRASRLAWRVEDETGQRAHSLVIMPPTLGRQRSDFLRFCD